MPIRVRGMTSLRCTATATAAAVAGSPQLASVTSRPGNWIVSFHLWFPRSHVSMFPYLGSMACTCRTARLGNTRTPFTFLHAAAQISQHGTVSLS